MNRTGSSPLVRSLLVLAFLALAACGDDSEDPGGSADCAAPCFSPPAGTCDGTALSMYNPIGECVDGACVYTEVAPRECADDGEICEDGACVAPPDPCDGVACDTPPEAYCDGDAVVSFDAEGTCVAADDGSTSCEYESERDTCRDTELCVNAACEDRPCVDVVCDTPPEAECDGTAIVTYEATGVCDESDESCSYSEASRVDCADNDQFCRRARCVATDPCEDVVCETPPDDYCDDETLVWYGADGVCSAGDCSYTENTTACADIGQICRDAVCRARLVCEDVVCETPPAAYCDGDVAVTFAASGTCADDDCVYADTRTTCTDGQVCRAGACADPHPCDDIVCEGAPENWCRGDVAVRYANPGTCNESGTCEYAETERNCADEGMVCLSGECDVDDSCSGIICNEAPPSECEDDTLTTFALPGECVAGECVFVEYIEDCSDGLRCTAEGTCEAYDPCEGIACDDPPAAYCFGDELYTYEGVAECIEGECDYDAIESNVDCADTDMACYDGACVKPGQALEDGDLIITEMFFGAGQEWIEIWSPDGPRDVSGLRIQDGDGHTLIVPDGTTFDTYTIVGHAAADVTPDLVWGETFTLGGTDAGSVTLTGGERVDRVAWSGSEIPFGVNASAALTTWGRVNGMNEAADWCASVYEDEPGLFATPRRHNGTCSGGFSAQDVAISEIMVQGAARVGVEQWLELWNTTGAEIDLGGALIVTDTTWYELPLGTALAADDRMVIGVSGLVADGPDLVTGGDMAFDETADTVSLYIYGKVSEIAYTGAWPISVARSLNWTGGPSASAPTDWCATATSATYPGLETNYGTPGGEAVCPAL